VTVADIFSGTQQRDFVEIQH